MGGKRTELQLRTELKAVLLCLIREFESRRMPARLPRLACKSRSQQDELYDEHDNRTNGSLGHALLQAILSTVNEVRVAQERPQREILSDTDGLAHKVLPALEALGKIECSEAFKSIASTFGLKIDESIRASRHNTSARTPFASIDSPPQPTTPPAEPSSDEMELETPAVSTRAATDAADRHTELSGALSSLHVGEEDNASSSSSEDEDNDTDDDDEELCDACDMDDA